MPELPEAEITARNLKPLIGRKIISFGCDWPRAIRVAPSVKAIVKDIVGRYVKKISRHGKAIFLHLSHDRKSSATTERLLVFHQRMSGRLMVKDRDEARGKHTHIYIRFPPALALHFSDPRKFGIIWYGQPDAILEDSYFSRLGPDARKINLKTFLRQLLGHRGMIKPLLLRQDILAGVGNIIADETLWRARIHPKTRLEKLGEAKLRRLHHALIGTIEAGIKAGGSTLRDWYNPKGTRGKFLDTARIYGRGGLPCRRCRTPIKRITVGGRGTWICTHCQRQK